MTTKVKKTKLLYATMFTEEKTYLLWIRKNKNTYSVHAIYFSSDSGLEYDGSGSFWDMNWSMKEWKYDNINSASKFFHDKVAAQLEVGYTANVHSYSEKD